MLVSLFMKKQCLVFMLLLSFLCSLSAQTLEEGKNLYDKGEYNKAKPVFAKYLKSNPSNGNYNLWYGVCCLKTGDSNEAIKYLEIAVKKRMSEGKPYLAEAYNVQYRFEDAIKCYEEYIAELNRRKKPTTDLNVLLDKAKNNLRMLKGVEQVSFIDSFIVDKQEFLNAYKISKESGTLTMYDNFFNTNTGNPTTVYETEIGNKIYYGDKLENGKLNIFTRNKLDGKWGNPSPLPEAINHSLNANYPYVLTDGLTIYYAAEGKESIGGYDIFVTRYNTNTDSYLTPENVGMPFNSPYNDYMFVIDEFNNLGWFASDRYQPAGRVCIYVFIPNETKLVYNYESLEMQKLINLAKIHAIKESWTDKSSVANAKKRLQQIINEKPLNEQKYDFVFVINDRLTYHQLNDFKSSQTKSLFGKYSRMNNDLKKRQEELDKLRMVYSTSTENEKAKLTQRILSLEQNVNQLTEDIERTLIEIRNTEIQTLK